MAALALPDLALLLLIAGTDAGPVLSLGWTLLAVPVAYDAVNWLHMAATDRLTATIPDLLVLLLTSIVVGYHLLGRWLSLDVASDLMAAFAIAWTTVEMVRRPNASRFWAAMLLVVAATVGVLVARVV